MFDASPGGSNIDTVSGFNVVDDLIMLDDNVFTGLAVGALVSGAFNTRAAATQADDRLIYNSQTGALLFDADGTGAIAALHFATFSSGLSSLSASDFLVI